MSSKCRTKGKITKKRPQRATSNVFAMFDQSQIQEFKEAFNMIDQNRDGFIDKEDLHDMLASLGKILLAILAFVWHFIIFDWIVHDADGRGTGHVWKIAMPLFTLYTSCF